MYFTQFNKIKYDNKNVTNITTRVSFIDSIKKNDELTFDYFIDHGESPEDIAYNFYGDAALHWIIILLNDIYDPVYGWYLDHKEFMNYVEDKYGDPYTAGGGYEGIHHWEHGDMILSASHEISSISAIIDASSGYEVGDKLISGIESIEDAVFLVTSVDVGGEITGLSIITSGIFLYNSDTSIILYGGHGANADIEVVYSTPDKSVAVSNIQYEEKLNEAKRDIKVLYPEHVTQMIQELQFLVKNG